MMFLIGAVWVFFVADVVGGEGGEFFQYGFGFVDDVVVEVAHDVDELDDFLEAFAEPFGAFHFCQVVDSGLERNLIKIKR